jgi:hypothetical protein
VYEPGTVEPGWTTTEFYQTLLVTVISAVVAISSLFKTHLNLDGIQAAVPTAAVVAATVAQAYYAWVRSRVKVAAQQAVANVKAAQATAGSAAAGPTTTSDGGPVAAVGGETPVPTPTVLTVHFDDLKSPGS